MRRKSTAIFLLVLTFILTLLPGGHLEGKDYIAAASTPAPQQFKTGLLIGLANNSKRGQKNDNPTKKTEDELRTLWIYSDSRTLEQKEKKGFLVAPYEKKFYELRNEFFHMEEESDYDYGYGFYSKYSYNYSYGNIVSSVIGQPRKPLYTEKSISEKLQREGMEWPYATYAEWPLFIGNKYACIMNDYYETGGGTYGSGFNSMLMYNVASLGNINERVKVTKLYNLLGKEIQKELSQLASKYVGTKNSNEISSERKVMDLNNLALARKYGKWIIKIPIFSKYYHEGNGSSYSTVIQYVDYEKPLPKELVGYDTLCIAWKDILKAVPKAVDAVSSPNKDLLVVLTNSELLVYKNPKLPLKSPQMRINVGTNQRIVLNQWSSGDEAVRWKSSLDPYFKGSSQSEGIVYKNEKLGFSFTMPKDWAGKYRIEETSDGIKVYFKPATPADELYTGALFYILVRNPDYEDFLDTVGQPRFFKAKGIEYIIGGPTDVTFDFEHPEYKTFSKMTQEISKIVATIKGSN